MSDYSFLKNHIQELPADREIVSFLNPPKTESQLVEIEISEQITVPRELKDFYLFSYGAILVEYQILTIPEIGNAIEDIQTTYGDPWSENIFPFAYLLGVGDYVAFDISKSSSAGTLILDGFHEFSPTEWQGICFGLETWLRKMVENNFHPFWLKAGWTPG